MTYTIQPGDSREQFILDSDGYKTRILSTGHVIVIQPDNYAYIYKPDSDGFAADIPLTLRITYQYSGETRKYAREESGRAAVEMITDTWYTSRIITDIDEI